MLLTAVTTLPGAAFVAQAKDKGKSPKTNSERKPNDDSAQTRRYQVADALKKIQQDQGFEYKTDASKFLIRHLYSATRPKALQFEKNRLKATHSRQGHRKIAEELRRTRKYGFQAIEIQTIILTTERDLIEKTIADWEIISANVPEDERPGMEGNVESRSYEKPSRPNGVVTTVERTLPIQFARLDDSQAVKLMNDCQKDPRTNIMFRPKVRMINGRVGTLQCRTKRPFVVGLDDNGEPRLRVVSEGIRVKLRPVLKDEQIRLASEITHSDIRGTAHVTHFPDKKGKRPKVQVPEIATTRINAEVNVPDGGSVLFGGLEPVNETNDPDAEVFVMLRVEKVEQPDADAKPGLGDVSDVELRYAQKAAELADLEYQKALEANRRLKGTVPKLNVERLKLKAELAHLQVEQVKQELEQKKARTDGEPSRQTGPAEGEFKAKQEKKQRCCSSRPIGAGPAGR